MASRAAALADAGTGDRWLLMRLLAAGRASPSVGDRLMNEFESLGGVLSASRERLERLGVDAAGVHMLELVREAVGAVLARRAEERPLLDVSAMAEWMRADMQHLKSEELRVCFADAGRRVMRVERMGTGAASAVRVYPREVAARALELGASFVVLAHNHPSGDPTPSREDVTMTRDIGRALGVLDVALIDHLVVARRGWRSLKSLGLIEDKPE